MPVIPPLCGRALRGLVLFMFITAILISGTTITANAKTDAYQEITSRILNLFPAFAGKVQDVQGSTVVIQAPQGSPVASGSYLMIKKETAKGASQPVLVRVTGVSGQEIRAERIGKQEIKKGDPVTGWPRPLPVALVPMSREALGVLMEYSPAKGDLAPVRTEDVLTAMIENHYADFSALGQMDLSVLGSTLKTPLILQVKVLSGFGENILQMAPYVVESGAGLDTFSVLLSSRSTSMAEARPLPAVVPAETMASTPPQQGVDILSPSRSKSEEAAAPLALSVAASNGAVQSSLPKLPLLTGFTQPTRWVRILEVNEPILSMAAGSFTGTGRRELALAFPGEIQIYAFHKNKLKEGEALEHPNLSTLFWLESYDLNGDGVDEIIGDTEEGVVLLSQRDGKPAIVHRKEGLVIRKIGDQLFAQELSGLKGGESPVHTVRWAGEDWEMGEALKGPESVNLFAMVSPSAETPLFIGSDHKLTNGRETVSDEEIGESNTPGIIETDIPIFARSLSLPDGSLVLKNRGKSWPHIKKQEYSDGGSVLFFTGQGAPLSSPPFRGYIGDIALYDMDGDGTGEILLSQTATWLFSDKAMILRYK